MNIDKKTIRIASNEVGAVVKMYGLSFIAAHNTIVELQRKMKDEDAQKLIIQYLDEIEKIATEPLNHEH